MREYCLVFQKSLTIVPHSDGWRKLNLKIRTFPPDFMHCTADCMVVWLKNTGAVSDILYVFIQICQITDILLRKNGLYVTNSSTTRNIWKWRSFRGNWEDGCWISRHGRCHMQNSVQQQPASSLHRGGHHHVSHHKDNADIQLPNPVWNTEDVTLGIWKTVII